VQNSPNHDNETSTAISAQGGQIENQTDYNTIYENFLKSKEWRKVKQGEEPFEIDSVEVESKKIFDFDSNGIPELWFIAKTSGEASMGKEEISGFCTITDNKVKILLSGYISGGTIGGDSVDIRFDKKTSEHVVGLTGYAGGFGGNMSWANYYSYKTGTLNQIIQFSQMSQIDEQYDDKELQDPALYYIEKENPFKSSGAKSYITIYKVNDKQITKEVYQKTVKRFILPGNKEFVIK
jgi:hypothetical protein